MIARRPMALVTEASQEMRTSYCGGERGAMAACLGRSPGVANADLLPGLKCNSNCARTVTGFILEQRPPTTTGDMREREFNLEFKGIKNIKNKSP
ncbi:hypothetical protein PUN28_000247 [Cardiocondyla obscurior]|uniref:Uncharacterized protein n=1 Tax=Cardiocondyla obscurior TaxID=286306 RepID=A0AAW2GYD0_9HYME